MNKIKLLYLFLLLSVVGANGQQIGASTTLVEVPAEYGVVFTMFQPECPVKFEELQFLVDEKLKSPKLRYLLKNKSTKQIVSFSVEFKLKSDIRQWGPFGDGWTENVGRKDENVIVIPFNGIYENIAKKNLSLVPMTKEILDILVSTKKRSTKIVWMGYIKRVVFSDGSEFNSEDLDTTLSTILIGKN